MYGAVIIKHARRVLMRHMSDKVGTIRAMLERNDQHYLIDLLVGPGIAIWWWSLGITYSDFLVLINFFFCGEKKHTNSNLFRKYGLTLYICVWKKMFISQCLVHVEFNRHRMATESHAGSLLDMSESVSVCFLLWHLNQLILIISHFTKTKQVFLKCFHVQMKAWNESAFCDF